MGFTWRSEDIFRIAPRRMEAQKKFQAALDRAHRSWGESSQGSIEVFSGAVSGT